MTQTVPGEESAASASERVPAGFERVCTLGDLSGDVPTGVTLADGTAICLVRRGDTVYAVRDLCTHQAFALSAGELLPDGMLECAWHGARFDPRTGTVCRGPACDPLTVYQVLVHDGIVHVGGRRDERT